MMHDAVLINNDPGSLDQYHVPVSSKTFNGPGICNGFFNIYVK